MMWQMSITVVSMHIAMQHIIWQKKECKMQNWSSRVVLAFFCRKKIIQVFSYHLKIILVTPKDAFHNGSWLLYAT